MSDKEETKKKKGDEERDKPPITAPEPADVPMFEFFSQHFTAESMPQAIELRQAFGQGGRTYSETVLWQKEFRQNSLPSQSEIIELVNKFLDLAQRNCTELGRATGYGFLFKNHAKAAGYYGVFYKKLTPKQRLIGDGEGGDEDVTPDAKHRDGLLSHSLEHMKESNLNDRWRQEQFAKSTGDIITKYQELLQMSMQHNQELMREHREVMRQYDEAMSHKLERELAAKQAEFRMGMMHDGFNFLKQMVPVAVNQITGKQTVPTKDTAESIAIRSFLDTLSKAQAEALFGEMDAEGRPTGEGIFSPSQTQIFAGVAQNQLEPGALEQLIDGEHAVDGDQLAKAQTVLSQQQVMPLMALIMGIKKKQFESGSEK